jgi:hypothetical protein
MSPERSLRVCGTAGERRGLMVWMAGNRFHAHIIGIHLVNLHFFI